MLRKQRGRFGLPIKKTEIYKKKNGHNDPLAKKVTWTTRGFSLCPTVSLTAASHGWVKPREGALVPTPFLLWKQPKLELGKAVTEPRGPGNHSSAQPTWEFGAPAGGGSEEHR